MVSDKGRTLLSGANIQTRSDQSHPSSLDIQKSPEAASPRGQLISRRQENLRHYSSVSLESYNGDIQRAAQEQRISQLKERLRNWENPDAEAKRAQGIARTLYDKLKADKSGKEIRFLIDIKGAQKYPIAKDDERKDPRYLELADQFYTLCIEEIEENSPQRSRRQESRPADPRRDTVRGKLYPTGSKRRPNPSRDSQSPLVPDRQATRKDTASDRKEPTDEEKKKRRVKNALSLWSRDSRHAAKHAEVIGTDGLDARIAILDKYGYYPRTELSQETKAYNYIRQLRVTSMKAQWKDKPAYAEQFNELEKAVGLDAKFDVLTRNGVVITISKEEQIRQYERAIRQRKLEKSIKRLKKNPAYAEMVERLKTIKGPDAKLNAIAEYKRGQTGIDLEQDTEEEEGSE